MCYGIGPDIAERIAQWKAQGYRVHVMTGVAWGQYQDYLYGRFDGVNHEDEAQTEKSGRVISHGGDVYYMSPGENYGKFLSVGVKRALEAGAEAIHLEEPEFWARAGWSKGFRREWKSYYGEDWIPPDSSPDAQYRASKLKYYLYQRALRQVFDVVREWNREHGTKVKCYVPTHSLINYALWCIVSPESSLLEVGADGFIAQVWTGTARSPNMYEGKRAERTFESAFLEYGAMMNIVQASGATVWFLNDPIEDNPNHTWTDYRTNWESTLTASLLWPEVWRYEVMPWPERIFRGKYPADEPKKSGGKPRRVPIPPDYATELMTVINALNDMRQPDVEWNCGTRGIGVLVSDTMMFQRAQPTPSDPYLGSFFGLALPLVKRGIPAVPVQLENAPLPGTLDACKVLLLTFEGMKPMRERDSRAVADWVRRGGTLVFVDDDRDPYNQVRAWWNEKPKAFANPREAFFAELGLENAKPGTHRVDKGTVIYDAASPAALTYKPDGADHVRALVREACAAAGLEYRESDAFTLRRGPYVVAAGIGENSDQKSETLTGSFIDLFDAQLPIRSQVALTPGSRCLLLDLKRVKARAPAVLAAAGKVLGEKVDADGAFRFFIEGPEGITASVRVLLANEPKTVFCDDQPLEKDAVAWDAATRTARLRFPNSASGHWITIR